MPRGFFTQTVCILLRRAVTLERLEKALAQFEICGRIEETDSWELGGPAVVLDYRPEVRGLVMVDIVDRPWPDDMGDPQAAPQLFAAWSMGHFGPWTFPGGLQRAIEQSWEWEAAKKIAPTHTAFVRLRSHYDQSDSAEDAPMVPPECDAADELQYLTKVAWALLKLPEALCYFNPGGEVLRDRKGLAHCLSFAKREHVLPLDAWSNVRLYHLDSDSNWLMMDTVGNDQILLTDIEACFSDRYDCNEVAAWLRSATWYLMENGEIIEDGQTMDGPGNIRWQAHREESGLCDPPRAVLRVLPQDGIKVPKNLFRQ